MEYHRIYILFLFLSLSIGVHGKDVECSITRLFMCGRDETCQQDEGTKGYCRCRPGFKRASAGNCNPLPPSQTAIRYQADKHNGIRFEPAFPRATPEQDETSGTSVSGSSILLGTFIPLALIGGAVALVYSARRYKWHERVRRLGIRRYEEVFIGRTEEEDDDAPIA
ncbi:uncharacterized protein [Hetaerina americana]|uniref:uncharacterized protein n=1 Tax=Hetaerina americana TaxID=62018 RepID=UPI003A7F529B